MTLDPTFALHGPYAARYELTGRTMTTRQQKETIIRAFWAENQGRFGATAGAKALSAESGIPVNTIRGIQNKLYPADARPWNLPVADPVHTCPVCEKHAYNQDDIVRDFGVRMVWRGPKNNRRQVQSHQSFCRTCKVDKRRAARAAKREAQAEAKAAQARAEAAGTFKVEVVDRTTQEVKTTLSYTSERMRDYVLDGLYQKVDYARFFTRKVRVIDGIRTEG